MNNHQWQNIGQENSAIYLQMRCSVLAVSKLFFRAEAGIFVLICS